MHIAREKCEEGSTGFIWPTDFDGRRSPNSWIAATQHRGGNLPPRTAKLAVLLNRDCIVPVQRGAEARVLPMTAAMGRRRCVVGSTSTPKFSRAVAPPPIIGSGSKLNYIQKVS